MKADTYEEQVRLDAIAAMLNLYEKTWPSGEGREVAA